MTEHPVIVIGAGPAGLTAAYELVRRGIRPLVIEKADKVGGLARTENYKGFHFDMGGHRFFTKVEEVSKMWHEVLGDDFLVRPRLSRIYYNRHFFFYPLRALNALVSLGCWQSVLIVLSYLKWQCFPYRQEDTFEQWVTNRFGKRLFLIFFKSYTEKVWGISCSVLRAEWAAQRIKDLSLRTALLNMVLEPKRTIRTLIEQFHYPRLGPGMMWNAVREEIERRDGSVRLACEVVEIHRSGKRVEGVAISRGGQQEVVQGKDFLTSMPISEFIQKLRPPPPPEVLRAAQQLKYRDFLTVCLILNRRDVFPDNWIYIHDPEVRVGRIQNFKNWSADMVPDPTKTSLGLEYFCAEGDELWCMPDADLVELGRREVDRIGLARYADVEDGCVFRVPRAYPVYDSAYRDFLAIVKTFVERLENCQTIGRNGLHRYNNQDHAMLTGILAARNLVLGEQNDLWSVNTDREYHEEILEETGIEEREAAGVVEDAIAHVFRKLDRVALGLSAGVAAGTVLFLATLWLLLARGQIGGPSLNLLGQFFPGYSVSLGGSLLGLAYGFIAGFIGGWAFAFLRNVAMFLYMAIVHRRAEVYRLRRFLEYL